MKALLIRHVYYVSVAKIFENFMKHIHTIFENENVGIFFLLSENISGIELSCYEYIHVRRYGSYDCVWVSFWLLLTFVYPQ